MGNLLLALAGPLAKRVLIALGLGVISYGALTVLASAVVAQVQALYGAIPANIIQFADLMGLGTAIGIILGGIVARATFAAISQIGRLSS